MSIMWDENGLDEIIPHLYLSNLYSAKNTHLIQKHQIKHIISISSEGKSIPEYENVNILFLNFKDGPSAKTNQYYGKTFNFIENAIQKKENVLVHCFGGVSRSPTIVAAYLIRKFGYTVREALNWIHNKRPCIDPIPEFEKQLQRCHYWYQIKMKNQ